MTSSAGLPPDEVMLLKLLWHPDDVDGDQVKLSAFRKQDLSGLPGNFVSVDRSDQAERSTMEALATRQAAKANGKDLLRLRSLIGRLKCAEVRAQARDGTPLFSVLPHCETWNAAHCGIHNISGLGRSSIDELRGKLARMASPAVSFDKAYQKTA